MEDLKHGGYILRDDIDELELISLNLLQSRYSTSGLGLTIAPTSDCNFRCIYCYEKESLKPVVNSATGGNGAGVESHRPALPNSGLVISYEAYHAFDDDGTCNAIVGTKPDIEVKEDQTALEACLEQIQNGISGNA